MSFLRYVEGAQPGKKRKTSVTETEKQLKSKEYELKRKDRAFNDKWKTGRPWLSYDSEQLKMFCTNCKSVYKELTDDRSRKNNAFILGTSNFRTSAIDDHEKSGPHIKACRNTEARQISTEDKIKTEAGKALKSLKSNERSRLKYLFRNAHALAKHNRPISDFVWLCELDKAKQIDIGVTYINDQAALDFIHSISKYEKNKTVNFFDTVPFFAFMMDGTTDISGSEQETIYLRGVLKGAVSDKFLNMGSPTSTSSEDLYRHVCDVFHDYNIETDKLVGMGSDGASNMTGIRAGLSTLLRERVNPEIINIHCLCHRLELAFRDVAKKHKSYDKLLTLLIGLHYFYKKSHKNKTGLINAIKVIGKGVMPPKVTGTRWLPHVFRSIGALLKTYQAFEIHLSTASHTNPKAEGLYKMMTDMHLMAFTLFLYDALDQAMRLSLKLQRDDATLSESMYWVECTMEILEEQKGRKSEALVELLDTRSLNTVKLKGSVPQMKYTDDIIDGFVNAIKTRFMTDARNVVNATRILHFGEWPSGSSELQEFGGEEIKSILKHFQKSIERASAPCNDISVTTVMNEWYLLKKIVVKKFGHQLPSLTWERVLKAESGLNQISLIIDLMLTLPPTSVKCETAFSQLKLLKTCRRARLGPTVLNDLLTVKMLSPSIDAFDPEPVIDVWMGDSIMGRRPTYKRSRKEQVAKVTEVVDVIPVLVPSVIASSSSQDESDHGENVETAYETESDTDENDDDSIPAAVNTSVYENEVDLMCDKIDDDIDFDEDCFDFQDEMINVQKLYEFSRE